MIVRHFMSRDVFTVPPTCRCLDLLRAMQERRIRRVPVMHRRELLGIVTLHDLWRILPGTIGQAETEAGVKTLDLPVEGVMSRPVWTLEPSDHLETAAQLMLRHKIGGVPVLQDRELVGIITESDIFRALWRMLSSGRGSRLVLEEPEEPLDYPGLLLKHHCRLHTLIRFERGEGRPMSYLRAEGTGIDALADELWSNAAVVLSVEKSRA